MRKKSMTIYIDIYIDSEEDDFMRCVTDLDDHFPFGDLEPLNDAEVGDLFESDTGRESGEKAVLVDNVLRWDNGSDDL